MKAVVYIIYSKKWNQYYVGFTTNIQVRLTYHNGCRNKSTRGGAPWELMYYKSFENEQLARKREYEIKKKKSRNYLEWLIKGGV